MRYKYGSHVHPEHEVSLKRVEIRPIFSPRNDRFASFYKHHLVIELQHTETEIAAIFAETNVTLRKALRQSYLNTKIAQLIDVYSDNYQSCGLFHDDDTPTRHYLSNGAANNISGVRVLYRSWDKDGGDEYATVRSAYVIVGAIFQEADSEIYNYREEVEIHGTGGFSWEWVENQTIAPTQQTIFGLTRQRIRQYGSIVGASGWLLGNVPPPLFPAWEKSHLRVQKYEMPKWHGNAYRLYGYQWSYHMEAPTGQVAVPNLY